MRRVSLLLISLAWSTASIGQVNSYAMPSEMGQPRFVIDQQYRDILTHIRKNALDQQFSDGGRLTQQHIRSIQFKIDEANRAYRNLLWKNDPSAVNADGTLRR